MVIVKPQEPKWITSEIKRLIRKRKRLYRQAKRSNSPNIWNKFRNVRNEIISIIKQAKQQQLRDVANLLLDNDNKKSWWSLIKNLMKRSTNNSIPPLHIGSEIVYNDSDKANAFNDFFVGQTNLNVSNSIDPPPPYYDIIHTLQDMHFEPYDITPILQGLTLGKAVGPDLINNRILKELSEQLSSPLCKLFNKSIDDEVFPESWKCANVCPVYKKDNASLVSNYRPISLL